MNAINMIFGADSHPAVKFSVIFLIVAVGLFILWFVVSKVLKSLKRGGFSSRSRQPRLGILEDIEIDAERRLLLIRRDNIEHLLMVGGKNDFVVEQNITRALQIQTQPQPLQPVLQEMPEEAMPSNNFRVAAKAQARAAAQVPVVEEPVVEVKKNYADVVTSAFKNPPKPEGNPFTTLRPAPVEAPKPVFSAQVKPQNAPTTFDSLEDEMAALLGQIKK